MGACAPTDMMGIFICGELERALWALFFSFWGVPTTTSSTTGGRTTRPRPLSVCAVGNEGHGRQRHLCPSLWGDGGLAAGYFIISSYRHAFWGAGGALLGLVNQAKVHVKRNAQLLTFWLFPFLFSMMEVLLSFPKSFLPSSSGGESSSSASACGIVNVLQAKISLDGVHPRQRPV